MDVLRFRDVASQQTPSPDSNDPPMRLVTDCGLLEQRRGRSRLAAGEDGGDEPVAPEPGTPSSTVGWPVDLTV